MENPSYTANKQKAIETSGNTQALQVATVMSLTTARGGSVPTLPLPGAVGPVTDPPKHNTSSDTSTNELSPTILGAIQRIVLAAIWEQIVTLAPPCTATPSDLGVLEEEAEECAPVSAPPMTGRKELPLCPAGGSPSVVCTLRAPSKGLAIRDIPYRGSPRG
ncbi:UNVERIFIED_CONTAM: hypothetical protein Sradi_6949000 [Sesamum radiatum]|uniref:Uncharacterized protein n=1 Tax=Sesamum radiatum TaxID=300843 RepID=A0AAW2JFK3_SESRA